MSERAGAPSGRKPNRLARESSPYLLQHAHNPVDWWAWGPAAFAEARRRDVPVFLSIGYSTCYWCHVMERESFEDDSIGALMNERFVCIKVDREERPDVDDLYMSAVQMMTGHGGWPMSVALEPGSLRPFWSGTYFPPEPRHGMPSFRQVLGALSEAWRTERARVLAQAEEVAAAVRERLGAGRPARIVGSDEVAGAVTTLLTIFDHTNGGFGGAPKFPQPSYCDLLMAARNAADQSSIAAIDGAVRRTLDRMAIGGLFDQVGGGFHRYSVDAIWLVPHFEKMLYDNGQLLETYATAAAMYGDSLYVRTAQRIAQYVQREMTAEDGAFYTAQDAEVDGREGLNYLWNEENFGAALGAQAVWASEVYGVRQGPNFRDPHHPDAPPSNVLRLEDRPERIAERLRMSELEFVERLDGINDRLLAARNGRKRPRRDEKVLAAWNGLMIGGLAAAGRLLSEPGLVKQASRAATAVLRRLLQDDGTLLRCRRGQESPIRGTLEDYAMLGHGLLELAAAEPSDARWLGVAKGLADRAWELLGDGSGGYFDTELGETELFVRARSTYDGAMPCGASVMLNNLVTLFQATGDQQWLERSRSCLASLSAAIAESPVATANSVRGLLKLLRLDASGVESHLSVLGADSPQRSQPGEVTVWASANEVYVTEDRPAEITLRMEIPPGLHINAAALTGDVSAGLASLTVAVMGGTGFEAYADYPVGEEAPGGSHRVLRNHVEFAVAIEARGPVTGRPRLVVRYQACTDLECLAPVSLKLDVDLRQGEGPYAAGLG